MIDIRRQQRLAKHQSITEISEHGSRVSFCSACARLKPCTSARSSAGKSPRTLAAEMQNANEVPSMVFVCQSLGMSMQFSQNCRPTFDSMQRAFSPVRPKWVDGYCEPKKPPRVHARCTMEVPNLLAPLFNKNPELQKLRAGVTALVFRCFDLEGWTVLQEGPCKNRLCWILKPDALVILFEKNQYPEHTTLSLRMLTLRQNGAMPSRPHRFRPGSLSNTFLTLSSTVYCWALACPRFGACVGGSEKHRFL